MRFSKHRASMPVPTGRSRPATVCSTVLATALASVAVMVTLFAAPPADAQDRFVLVAHADVPVDSIEREVLSQAFLQKSVRWSDGTPIRPVSLNVQRVRETFAQAVLGKSDLELKKYWQRQIFTGRGSPPPDRSTDEEVLDFVRQTPGAVGFVSAGTRTTGVKVLQLR